MTKDTVFYSKKTLNARGKILDISSPIVMGIINVTPDSFFDGGKYTDEEKVIQRARNIIEEGASVIDIGGYSSRPGATDISEETELERTVKSIQSILREFPEAIISIDTFRSAVARKAVEAGASIVNDISGGTLDPKMFQTVKSLQVPYILMHLKGTPQDMSSHATYDNLMDEIVTHLQNKIVKLQELGVHDLIIDPGFGFAKTPHHNFELLQKLDYLKILKMPILVGLSRKSMIYKTLNIDPQSSLNGTTAMNVMALMKGADILRVHDVKECVEAVKLYKSVFP